MGSLILPMKQYAARFAICYHEYEGMIGTEDGRPLDPRAKTPAHDDRRGCCRLSSFFVHIDISLMDDLRL